MTEAVGTGLDLPAIVAAARERSTADGPAWSAQDEVGEPASGRPVVAVARGAAFTFSYAEHPELLAAAGAEVVGFDPLRDGLPDGAAALVIGGGFPEEHGAELAGNRVLADDLRAHVAAGRPVHAECAGLLYLSETLDGRPMAGLLPGDAEFTARLTLGYRDAVALDDSVLFTAGSRVTGHEFHRTAVTWNRPVEAAWGWHGPAGPVSDGIAASGVHASYLHLHPAGYPAAITRFVRAAAGKAPE